jgi:hypothetical protein
MPPPTAPIEAVRHQLQAPRDEYTGNRVLSGSAETITKPAGCRWIWLATSDLTYFRFGGSAAAIPAADTDTNGSMLLNAGNGIYLDAKPHASISVISASAVLGFAWYRDQEGGIL